MTTQGLRLFDIMHVRKERSFLLVNMKIFVTHFAGGDPWLQNSFVRMADEEVLSRIHVWRGMQRNPGLVSGERSPQISLPQIGKLGAGETNVSKGTARRRDPPEKSKQILFL